MTTQMVRKQIYILKRHAALLKRLSQARGLSEAEIIRRAIDREAAGEPAQPAVDRSAWLELVAFLDVRQNIPGEHRPFHWNREEIYTDRQNRWPPHNEQD